MPSVAYRRWSTVRAQALDGILHAHTAVGGTGLGRRQATRQLDQAFAVLLAAQFQGFCRDLHSECVDHVVRMVASPAALEPLVRSEFARGRLLERGNAHPDSLQADFARLKINFWAEVEAHNPRNTARKAMLQTLNTWRNAIAHQDFDPARLGGSVTLRLSAVRRWRSACRGLARSFDRVMWAHLRHLTGAAPW